MHTNSYIGIAAESRHRPGHTASGPGQDPPWPLASSNGGKRGNVHDCGRAWSSPISGRRPEGSPVIYHHGTPGSRLEHHRTSGSTSTAGSAGSPMTGRATEDRAGSRSPGRFGGRLRRGPGRPFRARALRAHGRLRRRAAHARVRGHPGGTGDQSRCPRGRGTVRRPGFRLHGGDGRGEPGGVRRRPRGRGGHHRCPGSPGRDDQERP